MEPYTIRQWIVSRIIDEYIMIDPKEIVANPGEAVIEHVVDYVEGHFDEVKQEALKKLGKL